VRRVATELGDGRRISSLVWGERAPELVLLHGGAQNAHTWDTVALALNRPLVCVDLPGHGHSDASAEGSTNVPRNARDVAAAVRALAPRARGVVGMVARRHDDARSWPSSSPELVRAAVLVDVTPSVDHGKARAITAFVDGPASFASFDDILARTIAHNPTRSVASLRRGILHNALQRSDGSWCGATGASPRPTDTVISRSSRISGAPVDGLRAPLMLVRGMREQSVVSDADEAELRRRCPSVRIEHVQEAGHSVQGDAPVELARLLDDFFAVSGATAWIPRTACAPRDSRAFRSGRAAPDRRSRAPWGA
jgi:pimeloyl-ACP methyl ester carboxylesterase